MSTLALTIILLSFIGFILKLSFGNRWKAFGFIIMATLWTYFLWPYAIEQSKTQILTWLNDKSLMQNIAVLITVDVGLLFSFCVVSIHYDSVTIRSKRTIWLHNFLNWYPGLLIFPMLFVLLTISVFSFPGVAFTTIAKILSGIVFLLLLLGSFGIKKLLPEKEARLELLFSVNFLIALVSVLTTVNGQMTVVGGNPIEWKALGVFLIVLLLCAILGLIIYLKRNRTCD